jgi:hypothetical protein
VVSLRTSAASPPVSPLNFTTRRKDNFIINVENCILMRKRPRKDTGNAGCRLLLHKPQGHALSSSGMSTEIKGRPQGGPAVRKE